MASQTKFNIDEFRELVNAGKSRAEIIKDMGIKTYSTFNNLLLKLMDTDKKYYPVKTGRKTKQPKQILAKIGKRKNLTLSAKNLESSSFDTGDTFTVKYSKNKIILTLTEK